jgi:hypothetical protein
VAELRATEVYIHALSERMTLLMADPADCSEQLGAQLSSTLGACRTVQAAIRPTLQQLDPAVAARVDFAADLARQRVEGPS